MAMAQPPDDTTSRVKRVLEYEISQVRSFEAAEEIVRRAEELVEDETEEELGEEAAEQPLSAAADVERAARAPSRRDGVVRVLLRTAAESVAPTLEAPEVVEAAQEVLGEVEPAPSPDVERGRSLLKQAIRRRLSPVQALDVELFLAINHLPHPRWLVNAANFVTLVTTGGMSWMASVAFSALLGVRRAQQGLLLLVPSVTTATVVVEYPIKAIFRRRRPFISIVRAIVIGKKPGSWSFPSGHTASSFAAAWLLSTVWPRRAPVFFSLASLVGFSRIYVGAHYPTDVMSGACLGMLFSELTRRFSCRLMKRHRLI